MANDATPAESECVIRRLDFETASMLAPELLLFSADQEWENWTPENLLCDRPRKWDLSLVALISGQPAGYAVVSTPEPGRHHVHRIAVPGNLRGLGVGSRLMTAALEQAKHEGATLSLRVYTSNLGAIAFYKRLGFAILEATNEQLLMSRDA